MKSKLSFGILNIAACLILFITAESVVLGNDLSKFTFSKPNAIHNQNVFSLNKISGKITDESGLPLAGATILVKGTKNAAKSDNDGNFSINAEPNSTLIITYVGFETTEVEINNQTNISVQLKIFTAIGEQIIVVGYGTQKKGEVTSAISSLNPEDFNKGNIIDPLGLLQGKVAGLNIVNSGGGDPNAGLQIQLRGLTTLSGGTGPLIIIDGVLGGDLNSVNVEEIASIDVLKDGSAAAIYGTRGTNGVVIITTKRAKAGAQTIDFSTYISTQNVAKKLKNLSASEFRGLLKTLYPGREGEFDHGYNTDWFDEITHVPLDQYYNLALSGGVEKFSYRASLNYRTSQGLVQKNANDRIQAKIAINQKGLNDKLSIDYKLIYAHTNRKYADRWALQQAFRYNPTEPVYDSSNTLAGGYYRNAGPFEYYNPVAMINERNNEETEEVLTGSLNSKYNITRGINLNFLASIIRGSYNTGDYLSRYYPIGLGNNGVASRGSGTNTNKLMEISGDYLGTFGDHNLQGVAGYSYQDGGYDNIYASNSNFDTDLFGYNNLGAGYGLFAGNADMSSHKESNKLIAFFGRATYSFKNKYLLTASTRYEGSSRFGKNNKWGLFPAVSVGWRINKESFLSNVEWISFLKLRAGYGVTGNQDIGNYRALQLLTTGQRFYSNGQWLTTYPPASNPNPNLKWERKEELDMGLDFGIFENRISGNIDYYVRNTSDLLWTYSVPVPPNVYNEIYTNVGKMRNSGIEVTINAKPVDTKDFTWNVSILYNSNKNRLLSFSDTSRGYQLTDLKQGWLGADLQTWTHQIVEGGAIGNFVAPVFLGIDDTGNSIFLDKNKDGIINDADREIVGNAYPKYQLSLNNTFQYKNFDLNIFFRGVFGNHVLNMHRMYYENFSYFGGKNILLSAIDYPDFKGKAEYSSRYIENASYIKLDNLSIGYNFKINEGSIFKKVRVYVTGQQLITITKYKGVDPEITLSGLNPGVDDYSYYPRTRKFTFGVNVGL